MHKVYPLNFCENKPCTKIIFFCLLIQVAISANVSYANKKTFPKSSTKFNNLSEGLIEVIGLSNSESVIPLFKLFYCGKRFATLCNCIANTKNYHRQNKRKSTPKTTFTSNQIRTFLCETTELQNYQLAKGSTKHVKSAQILYFHSIQKFQQQRNVTVILGRLGKYINCSTALTNLHGSSCQSVNRNESGNFKDEKRRIDPDQRKEISLKKRTSFSEEDKELGSHFRELHDNNSEHRHVSKFRRIKRQSYDVIATIKNEPQKLEENLETVIMSHYGNVSVPPNSSIPAISLQTVLDHDSISTASPDDAFLEFENFSSPVTKIRPTSKMGYRENAESEGNNAEETGNTETEAFSTEPKKSLVSQKKYPVHLWKLLGLYEDSYLDSINEHWLKFEPPSALMHKVFATLYGVFMIVGCGGNLLVIYMFVRCRSLRTPPNYLHVNLAISDFFMMAKTPIFIINSLYRGPVLGALGCKIYGFIGGLTGVASIMTLATIALDRYYVIVHPLNPFKKTTSRRAVLMIFGVWLYAAIFSSIPLYWINNYTSEGFLTSCSFDYLTDDLGGRIFIFVFFMAAWFVPLIIISFSYFSIFSIVREAGRMEGFCLEKEKTSGESFKFRPDQGKQKTEVKIAMLAAILISLWLLAWTPYAVVALLGIFGWKEYITPLVSSIPSLFCKTASCVDPFVYSMNHPRFRSELRFKFRTCIGYHPRKDFGEDSLYSAATYRCDNENALREYPNLPDADRVANVPVINQTDVELEVNTISFKIEHPKIQPDKTKAIPEISSTTEHKGYINNSVQRTEKELLEKQAILHSSSSSVKPVENIFGKSNIVWTTVCTYPIAPDDAGDNNMQPANQKTESFLESKNISCNLKETVVIVNEA